MDPISREEYPFSSQETLLGSLSRRDDHPALVVPQTGETITHGELRDIVELRARALAAHGVRAGDAVAMALGSTPEMVVSFLAVVAAGAAAAPLNSDYTADEFRAYLEDLRPRAMLLSDAGPNAASDAAQALDTPILRPGDLTASVAELPTPDPDAIALLLHTSGTTSRPKLVPLRQRNLVATIRAVIDTYDLGPDDISHCVMPLFHVHGLVASTLSQLAAGGTVLVAPRFSASAFWPDTVAHRATWFSAVPTIHAVLCARAESEAVPAHRLRFARSCSAALAPSLQEGAERLFGVPVVQAYGMTEAAHQMTSNPLPPRARREGTVGVPTGTEIAILDRDWGPLGPGALGEVAVRGPSVIDSYLDNPVANEESFRDGWFRTGDLGEVSADGYLRLEGRIKEMINRGGEKISPYEVEETLLRHPAVAEAVVFAAPDPMYGERVAAAVVIGDSVTVDTLREHCAAHVASFKVPSSIAILDVIPKGPTGKVQRRLMAEALQQ
jgi:oxalate---CoA ligase